MSEKQAKRIRELDRRISHLEAVKPAETDPEAADRWERAILAARMERLRADRAEKEAQYQRRAEREAREAASRMAVWKWVAFGAIVTAIIVELLAIAAVNCRAVEPPVSVEPMQVSNYTPAPQIVAQEPEQAAEDAENELIEAALLAGAQVIEDCLITHYDTEACCNGEFAGWTASGVRAVPGVTVAVAVDPRRIPLGSDVMIDYHDDTGIHYYTATDTGSDIKGAHIDVCVSSHQAARDLGVKYATVYWVEPGV